MTVPFHSARGVILRRRGPSRRFGWWLLLCLFALPAQAAEGGPERTTPKVEVAITGVSDQLLGAVRAGLSLEREKAHPRLTVYRIRALHRRAPREIRESLRPFGYYRPRIDASLEESGGVWHARYRIDPGPPVRVTTTDLRITGPGAADPAFGTWKGQFPLHPGDRLRDALYEKAKGDLQQLARDRGYLAAKLEVHTIRVDVPAGTAAIALYLVSGPRYRFGPVTFDPVPLRRSLLRRYLTFAPGDPYDADRIFQLQKALADSNYFTRVEVVPQTAAASGRSIPVQVHLAMRKRSRYAAGIGYGTDTGPRLTLGLDRRWVNDRGHSFSGKVTFSGLGSRLDADYRIPLKSPSTDYLDILASHERVKTATSDRSTSQVAAALTRSLGAWLRTLSLNYQEERYTVAGGSETSAMLYPQASWQRIEADDRLFPTRGWSLRVDTKLASRSLASATDLAQIRLNGKYIHPLADGRLLTRLDAGASQVSDFEKLPASLRFFAGGDNSIRGFAYQSLGPKNGDGEVVGGRYLLVGSVEYDHYFTERYGGAVFLDAGNAYNSRPLALARGAGVGLRVRLPFGVIRADLAVGVSEPDHPWRIHITIGPDL